MIVACTLLCLPIREKAHANDLAMIYLVGVVIVAARVGILGAIFSSFLGVLAFNFFFTQPYHSLVFYDSSYIFTFATMLITSLIVGSMTARLKRLAEKSKSEERDAHLLLEFANLLSKSKSIDEAFAIAKENLSQIFGCTIIIEDDEILSDTKYNLTEKIKATETEFSVKLICANSETNSKSDIFLFKSFCGILAGAINRIEANEEAAFHRVESENEKLRNVLLSSLSHDLRTPLTIMNGKVAALLKHRKSLPREGVKALSDLWQQLNRMQNFVTNLLKMAAISSDKLQLNKVHYTIEEIIGAAIERLKDQKGDRKIRNTIRGTIPMLKIDGAMIEQVVFNILDNAFQHTKNDGEILIEISANDNFVSVSFVDNGEGIPKGAETDIFNKFAAKKEKTDNAKNGTGLGLAICKAIIEAHNGKISAKNQLAPQKGAIINFELPISND